MKRRTCGRIDDHPAHGWMRPKYAWWYAVVWACQYRCSGHVVIEGGHRA